MNKLLIKRLLLSFVSMNFAVMLAPAFAAELDSSIIRLQQDWAIANYQTTEADLEKTFETLNQQAQDVVKQFPGTAEPLIWQAIILSTDAGKNGGLSALGKVKEARKLLLEAEKINPQALDGSIYTSLGSLYYQVPGWPIGFGDDDEAKKYLSKALEINSQGIDPNFFYGDFLMDQGQYAEAKQYFEKALQAPARPNRPNADKGRRAEIAEKIKVLNSKL